MNMKRKPVCALLLGLLVIVFPMIASAAADAAIAQEIHVTNTPIRGTIEIDKQGPVLTGFSEHEDAFGYIPYLQLCVCYDRLGEREAAAHYNRLAGEIRPESPQVLQNRAYFASLGVS